MGWQLITFNCQKWTHYRNHYWQRNDFTAYIFNIALFTSPSSRISHKYLHICTSQKSKPNDTFNPTGQSSLEVQLEKTFLAFYRNGRLITVHKSLVFTIPYKMDRIHILPLIKDQFQYRPPIQCPDVLSYLLSIRYSGQNFVQLFIYETKSY
jgi:hypothetical protein